MSPTCSLKPRFARKFLGVFDTSRSDQSAGRTPALCFRLQVILSAVTACPWFCAPNILPMGAETGKPNPIKILCGKRSSPASLLRRSCRNEHPVQGVRLPAPGVGKHLSFHSSAGLPIFSGLHEHHIRSPYSHAQGCAHPPWWTRWPPAEQTAGLSRQNAATPKSPKLGNTAGHLECVELAPAVSAPPSQKRPHPRNAAPRKPASWQRHPASDSSLALNAVVEKRASQVNWMFSWLVVRGR